MNENVSSSPSDFIRNIVREGIKTGKNGGRVATRFPPEPNGYLHIGHAKSICINFGIASEYGGACHLRFDDTNPTKEDVEYVESIKEDVKWLGFDWGDNLYHASDHFEKLYQYAIQLLKAGKAYESGSASAQASESELATQNEEHQGHGQVVDGAAEGLGGGMGDKIQPVGAQRDAGAQETG